MSIITRGLNSIQTRLTGIPRLEKTTILNRELNLRRGTYRKKTDYDDAWLFACALRSHTVLDIGSNIGQASVIMTLSPTVKQIALVDPNPNALGIAADNLIRNGLSYRTSYICAFVSDIAGSTQTFWTVSFGAAGSMYKSHAQTASRKDSHFEVNTTTIDEITTELRIDPDLIKVDVEGAESKVLAGGSAYALQKKTRYFVEMHSSTELPMIQNAAQVLEWCTSHGYTAWYLRDHKQLTSPDQIANRGRCHLLLQPGEWEYPDWLLPIQQSDPLEKAASSI